jgi:gluconate 2-dehydrogenase gamma chain
LTERSVSRRDVLRSLAAGAMVKPLLRAISIDAAEQAHKTVQTEKGLNGAYKPKFFQKHQYQMLETLCEAIIPANEEAGGAVEAGTPEFIDLLTSENQEYQLKLSGGMMWLDAACTDRFGHRYLDCSAEQQKDILDRIAYRKSAESDPVLAPGIEFFSFLRMLTADGFFTSRIGIKYLGYIGNTYLAEFPGCPAVPEN